MNAAVARTANRSPAVIELKTGDQGAVAVNRARPDIVKMICATISIVASRTRLAATMSISSPASIMSRTATSAAPTPDMGTKAATDALTQRARKKYQGEGRGGSTSVSH